MAGGLDAAAELNWESKIKFVIVITDAPGHGRELHDLDAEHDRFIDGDPAGKDAASVIHKLQEKNIDMVFCHIVPDSTRKMFRAFCNEYKQACQDPSGQIIGEHQRVPTEVQLASAEHQGGVNSSSFHVIFCLD